MIEKFLKRVTIEPLVAVLVSSLLMIPCACAPTGKRARAGGEDRNAISFRFVFLGDSRGDYKADPPQYLAGEVLEEITQRILELQPKPAFVIFNGDMIAKTAYTAAPDKIEEWKSLFLHPLKKENIEVYITPGNHIVDQKSPSPRDKIEYVTVFNNYYKTDNPENGPAGYKGVTYSFTYRNVHFVTTTSFNTHNGLDSYELEPEHFLQRKKYFEYFVNRENREWLAEDLRTDGSDFTIFFTHCPIYPIGPHYADKKSLHAHPANRAVLANMLIENNVDVYLASHEHLYARVHLDSDNPRSSGLQGDLLEVVVGSASAPPEDTKRKDMKYESYAVGHEYLVGDVRTDTIEFSVHDQNGNEIDDFVVPKKRTQAAQSKEP